MVWEVRKLGEVCDFLGRGISPKYLEDGGVRVVNQKCIRDHIVNYELARRHNNNEKKVPLARFIKPGDVLVNSTGTGTLGRVALVRSQPKEQTTVDSHVTIVRPIEGMFIPEFFGLMLIKIEDEIKMSGEGCGGQTELARKKLAEMFNVSFPSSHEEQKHIVAILDEAFEQIDQAKANAEQNLKNAREVFESTLNQIFKKGAEKWAVKSLNDIGLIQTGNTPKTSDKANFGDYIPFIKPGDFNVYGSLNYQNEGLSEIGAKLSRVINKNSVLMVCIGATIGKCGFSEFDITCNQQINALSPSKGNSVKFIYYQMLSKSFQKSVLHKSGQATLPIINKSKWSALTLNIPTSLEEQNEIVKKLNNLRKQTQSLEEIYQQKIQVLDELKQSLLQKAFSGELTKSADGDAA